MHSCRLLGTKTRVQTGSQAQQRLDRQLLTLPCIKLHKYLQQENQAQRSKLG